MQLQEAKQLAEDYGCTLVFGNGTATLTVDGDTEELYNAQIAEMDPADFIQFYLE